MYSILDTIGRDIFRSVYFSFSFACLLETFVFLWLVCMNIVEREVGWLDMDMDMDLALDLDLLFSFPFSDKFVCLRGGGGV